MFLEKVYTLCLMCVDPIESTMMAFAQQLNSKSGVYKTDQPNGKMSFYVQFKIAV